MEISRSYFSHAVRLNPNNTRSLFGLFLVMNVFNIIKLGF